MDLDLFFIYKLVWLKNLLYIKTYFQYLSFSAHSCLWSESETQTRELQTGMAIPEEFLFMIQWLTLGPTSLSGEEEGRDYYASNVLINVF